MSIIGNCWYIAAQQRLAQLDQLVAKHLLGGIGESSAKSLKAHTNAYVSFCNLHCLYLFDPSALHFQRYAAYLAQSFKSVEAIKNYISGAKKIYLLMGFIPPDITDYIYRLTIKGVTRDLGHVVQRANPITPDMWVKMFDKVDFCDVKQLVVWVAILLGFYSFFRKSNLVPDTSKTFDPWKQLCCKNIYRWAYMYVLRVFWAKNIQFRKRELIIPLVPNPDKRICPVFWLSYMLIVVPASADDPALSVPAGDSNIALSYNQLTRWFKVWVQECGYNSKHFSSHSLCRGGASWAAHCGLPAHVIRLMGDWKTQTFVQYIELSLQSRYDAVCKFNMAM